MKIASFKFKCDGTHFGTKSNRLIHYISFSLHQTLLLQKPPTDYIPYGRKFWRGIYFGGLAVLRAIRQYFTRQIAAQCDVIIIAKSYQCVYTSPVARRASLIVAIEFTIKSCVRRHHFSKEFIVPRWEKSWLVCQGEEGNPNDVYTVL